MVPTSHPTSHHRPMVTVLVAVLSAVVAIAPTAEALSPPFFPIPYELNQTAPCEQFDPEAVTLADGDLMSVWIGSIGEDFGIAGRRLSADGAPDGDELALFLPVQAMWIGNVELAALPDGGFLLAWVTQFASPPAPRELALARFDALGERRSLVTLSVAATTSSLSVDADDGGAAALTWTDGETAWLVLFDADLNALTGTRPVAQPLGPSGRIRSVDLARLPTGETLLVWDESGAAEESYEFVVRGRSVLADGEFFQPAFTITETPANDFDSVSVGPTVTAFDPVTFVVGWTHDSGADLDTGVYAREVPHLGSGLGPTFAVHSSLQFGADDPEVLPTAEGGYAFVWAAMPPYPPVDPLPRGFDPEIRVRLFGTGGVPVADDLTLWDSEVGRLQSTPAAAYSNGRLTVVWRDHLSFPPILPPPCPEEARILAFSVRAECVPSSTRLCLQDGRLSVEVARSIELPGQGSFDIPAQAVPLTDDTGSFWFFRPQNVEVVAKVIDGRAINGRFWFFSGGMSDVDYTIRVTDHLTAIEKEYPSGGRLKSFADTATFFDPPPPPFSRQRTGSLREAAADPPVAIAATTHPIPECDLPEVLCLYNGGFRARLEWTDPRTGNSGVGRGVNLTDESGYFWFFNEDNVEVAFKLLDGVPVNGYYWAFVGGLTDVEYTLTVASFRFPPGDRWVYTKPAHVLESAADTRALTPGCPNCVTAPGAPRLASTAADGGEGSGGEGGGAP